jgi:hypothetical protein
MVLFSSDGIEKVLSDFDFRVVSKTVENKKVRAVINHDGEDVVCPSCEHLITESHVGTIAKGSRLVFCDNPVCFSTWIAQNKL